MIVLPVNLTIVTLFRKAKLKRHTTKLTKSSHIAKASHWRKVQAIESIQFPVEDKPRNKSTTTKYEYESQVQMSKKSGGGPGCFKRMCGRRRDENPEYKRESTDDARNKKQGRNLPHWTIYIAWFRKFQPLFLYNFNSTQK
jgi:hypothetical protein